MSPHVNLFKSSTDTTPVQILPLAEALNAIQGGLYQKPVAKLRDLLATKGQQAYDKAKKQLAAVTFCGTFSPTRAKANLTTHSGIVHGDLDHLADLQATKHALCSDPHTVYCFVSPSGTGLKVGVHVEPVPDDTQYKHAWQAVADYHQRQHGITWDASGKDVCRLCYVSWDPDLYNNPDAQLFGVPPYHPPAPKPKPPLSRASGSLPTDRLKQYADRAMHTAVEMIDASVPPTPTSAGTRHEARRKAAYLLGGYIAGGVLDYGEARAALAAAVERNTTDFTSAMHTIDDCLTAGQEAAISLEDLEAERRQWLEEHRVLPQQRQLAHQDATQRQNGQPPGAAADDGALPYSDYTNALTLVREHGLDLRYCTPWGKWFTWHDTHWLPDTTGAVMRCAKLTIKRLARQAEHLDDDTAVKALMGHVKSSLATSKLKAMIESAQSEPGIPVQPEHLDADRWLLNVANGTLDLQRGTLRPHERTDLLTRGLPMAYDSAAQCPTWDAFLDRIMDENQNLISFLQRAVGYALTGVIREHVLLILWGRGRNGKSTFLNTLRALLGPYAMKAPSELLLVSNNDRHPTERADLFGKRFVAAIETEQGRRLAEVFVKEATGGDPIRARRMREDFWEFQPTHKVFLATNHKPVIKGTDNAIWERIRLIPFTVTIPKEERDTTLPDKLQAELPGILAWAVRGGLAWQQDGLGEPDEVQQATAGYRTEMDVLGQFITECCVVGDNYRVKADKLYETYKLWHGEQAQNHRAWGIALTERGFERYTNNGTWYRGIGLRTPIDDSRKERNHTEPIFGINSTENFSRDETRKIHSVGSVPSVGSAPVDALPTDAGETYNEVVI